MHGRVAAHLKVGDELPDKRQHVCGFPVVECPSVYVAHVAAGGPQRDDAFVDIAHLLRLEHGIACHARHLGNSQQRCSQSRKQCALLHALQQIGLIAQHANAAHPVAERLHSTQRLAMCCTLLRQRTEPSEGANQGSQGRQHWTQLFFACGDPTTPLATSPSRKPALNRHVQQAPKTHGDAVVTRRATRHPCLGLLLQPWRRMRRLSHQRRKGLLHHRVALATSVRFGSVRS